MREKDIAIKEKLRQLRYIKMYYSEDLLERIYYEIGKVAVEKYSDYLIRDNICTLSEISLQRADMLRLDEILPLAALAAPVAKVAGTALRIGGQVPARVGKAAVRGGIQATKFAVKNAIKIGKNVANYAAKGINYAKDAVKAGINNVTSAVKSAGSAALNKLKSGSFNKVTNSLKQTFDEAKKFLAGNEDVSNLLDAIKNSTSEENYKEVLSNHTTEALLVAKEFFINKIFTIFAEKGLTFKKDLNDIKNLDALAGLAEQGNFDKMLDNNTKALLVGLCLLSRELLNFAKNAAKDKSGELEDSKAIDNADDSVDTSGNASLSSMLAKNDASGT